MYIKEIQVLSCTFCTLKPDSFVKSIMSFLSKQAGTSRQVSISYLYAKQIKLLNVSHIINLNRLRVNKVYIL